MEQLGNGEEEELFILDSQQGHFFTPLGEHLGCLIHLGGGRKEEKEEGKDGEERVREKGVEFCTTIPSAREEIILQLRWRNICTVQFV